MGPSTPSSLLALALAVAPVAYDAGQGVLAVQGPPAAVRTLVHPTRIVVDLDASGAAQEPRLDKYATGPVERVEIRPHGAEITPREGATWKVEGRPEGAAVVFGMGATMPATPTVAARTPDPWPSLPPLTVRTPEEQMRLQLALIWRGAIAMCLLTLLLMLATIVIRARMLADARRREAFVKAWRPRMMECLLADVTPPPMRKADWPAFMVLWNHLHESLRGEAKDRLNAFGRAAGLAEAARRFLRGKRARRRLIAVMTLGNLREEAAWDELERLVHEQDAYLSLGAMRALVQIDPDAAVGALVRAVARREDWAPTRVAQILGEAGSERFARPMIEALDAAPPDQAVRLLRYLAIMKVYEGEAAAHAILATSEVPEVLGAALQLAGPRDVERVRELSRHELPYVRVHAATALGRVGRRGDDQLLVAMLGDPDWWVRYRAANALVDLPFVGPAGLAALRPNLPSEAARDIVGHVLAEKGGA